MPSIQARKSASVISELCLISPTVLDECNIEFNPVPFIQETLIVEAEGLIIVDSKAIVNELPCGQMVDKDAVHIQTNEPSHLTDFPLESHIELVLARLACP